MQVYNNAPAFSVWKHYSFNVNNMRKSMSKLASGLRINEASDDPAGLAISERLRAQYRNTAAYAKDFLKEQTAPGLAATTPPFVVCAVFSEEPCGIGASRHPPKDSSSKSPSATCVTATGGM